MSETESGLPNEEEDVIVCRCEEIGAQEIMAAIAAGCDSVTWVKRMTRAGMGLCQGRTCGRLVARMVAQETGQDPGQVLPDTHRPPLRPLGHPGREGRQ